MTNHNTEGYSTPKTLLTSVLIILAGVAFTWVIFSTEPTAKREGATRKTPMLVETTPVTIGDFNPIIEAMGTVVPSREIQLKARVSGQILNSDNLFVPGKTVEQGTLLLQLDAADYQNQLTQRQSDLNQAQADLQIEMGEQLGAKQDYQKLGREVNDTQKALILRAPQLASAKAQVSAARSSLEQAELSLTRTQIKAPFDAQIQNIYVNLGSQVNVGDNLADLVGVEHYWIESTLPINQLAWLNQPQEGVNIEVKIEDRLAWPEDTFRTGRLVSIMGQVDDNTRMARVLIEVNDPIGIKNNSLPKLTLGAFVNTHIPAKELTDVARIDRKYVRKNDTLWLMVNDQLNIKQLNVVFRDEQYFYVSDTLNAGDQMVTTDLSRVIEGAPLRLNKGQPNER